MNTKPIQSPCLPSAMWLQTKAERDAFVKKFTDYVNQTQTKLLATPTLDDYIKAFITLQFAAKNLGLCVSSIRMHPDDIKQLEALYRKDSVCDRVTTEHRPSSFNGIEIIEDVNALRIGQSLPH